MKKINEKLLIETNLHRMKCLTNQIFALGPELARSTTVFPGIFICSYCFLIIIIAVIIIIIIIIIIINIELTHSKTILENTVEIGPHPVSSLIFQEPFSIF